MTPTAYPVMEVLAARWRLGFDHWTFPGEHPAYRKALTALQLAGYVGMVHHDCNGNWLAKLAPRGIEAWGLNSPMADSSRSRHPQ